MLVSIDPGSLHVLRSSDWQALVTEKDYHAQAGSRVVVLPDSALAADIVTVLRALGAGPSGGPTGAPPG